MDGKYSISATPGATLVISYIGYDTKEVKVGNQNVINVTLSEDSQSIDEVVIVGASMKKSDLTGAISHVDAKVLEERPVTTVNEALQGRVAGVLITKYFPSISDIVPCVVPLRTTLPGATPTF